MASGKMDLTNAALNYRQLVETLVFWAKVRRPMLIEGDHGIGKSSVVAQARNLLTEMDGIERTFIDLRVGQMSDGDVQIPSIQGERCRYALNDMFFRAVESPAVLFCDEIDKTNDPAVLQPLQQACDSHRISAWDLHEHTIIVAARNLQAGKNNDGYYGESMCASLQDRWITYAFVPSHEEFHEYADNGGIGIQLEDLPEYLKTPYVRNPKWECPLIKRFLRAHEHLIDSHSLQPNLKQPSRRSWEWLGRALQDSGLSKSPHKNAVIIQRIASGCVGQGASAQLYAFCVAQKDAIQPADIFANNREAFAGIAELSAAEQTDLLERMTQHADFAQQWAENRDCAFEAIMRCNSEVAMRFLDSADSGILKSLLMDRNESNELRYKWFKILYRFQQIDLDGNPDKDAALADYAKAQASLTKWLKSRK